MTVAELEPMLTIAELAYLAKQHPKTIEKKIRAGKIKATNLGERSPRISRAEARRYLGLSDEDGKINDQQENPEQ